MKRLFVHIGGFNLGRLMRTLMGVGTPRGLQGRAVKLVPSILAATTALVLGWIRGRANIHDRIDHFTRDRRLELRPVAS